MVFEAELLQDYDSSINDYPYKKGQRIYVNVFDTNFKKSFAIYDSESETLDWLPKNSVKLIY